MYSLFLDSSNRDLNIGLVQNEEVVDRICYAAWQRQSELMVKEIDVILKRNNLVAQDIDEVVVTIGPGSYTGIRIALTIAKTFALALNIKIVDAISSLIAQISPNLATISLINARSNRSYIAVYNESSQEIVKDTVWTNEEVINWISKHPDFIIAGDVGYLNLPYHQADVLQGMVNARKRTPSVENALTLKPVYLKDLL